MIRLNKFKFDLGNGKVYTDPDFLTVAKHPEYTLQTGHEGFGSSWALYKNSKFVRSFADLKAARKYLTDLLEPNKGGAK